MKQSSKTVKCAYCDRDRVPVTKKGYMKPHVTPSGIQCFGLNIPDRYMAKAVKS